MFGVETKYDQKHRPTSLRSLTTKHRTILHFLLALTFEKLLFLLIKNDLYTYKPIIHLPERKIQVYYVYSSLHVIQYNNNIVMSKL